MFVRYNGLQITPSYAAMRELMDEAMTLLDVLQILEEGYDAPRKRKKGTIEKWLNKGNKTYNAVIAKDYNEMQQMQQKNDLYSRHRFQWIQNRWSSLFMWRNIL